MDLQFKYIKLFCLLILCGIITVSCTKYENPPPVFEEMKDLVGKQRKVMVISIDGVSGQTIKTVQPTQILALSKNSKYSYNTLKTISGAAGWVSMLTGTGYVKHKTSADNFEREIDDDHEDHGSVTSYRNVLDYVTQYKAVRTAMISPWNELRHYVRNADYLPIVDNDLKVKDSTINLLSSVQSLGTVFVNFRDAYNAGESGGFNISNVAYVDAIKNADQHIGELVKAIQARSNFDKEDWLVIVTTNIGGGNDNSSDGFVMLYNPAFQEFELKKSGFNGIQFNPSTVNAEVENDRGLYDAGVSKDFTVQMDVKFNVSTSYPGFLSKSTAMNGGNFTGWLWMQSGGSWGIVFGGTQNGGNGKNQISGANGSVQINDGAWHKLTMAVKTTGGSTPTARTVTAFIDGEQTVSGNILGNKSISVEESLRVGYRMVDGGGGALNHYAANLTYFDIALDAATVKNTHTLTDIKKHPNYANLIGFWPMDEGTEGTLYNHAPGGHNMALHGPYRWMSLGASFPPGTLPQSITSNLSVVSSGSDIAPLVLYWMKINILPDFGFDGSDYLKNFEIEFLKD
jgi:hypothetical protein